MPYYTTVVSSGCTSAEETKAPYTHSKCQPSAAEKQVKSVWDKKEKKRKKNTHQH